jgi:CBS domain containing-hemolysin-like protein
MAFWYVELTEAAARVLMRPRDDILWLTIISHCDDVCEILLEKEEMFS